MFKYDGLVFDTFDLENLPNAEEKLREVTEWANKKRLTRDGLTITELCSKLGVYTYDIWGCDDTRFDPAVLVHILKVADLWGWDKDGFHQLYRYKKVRI